MQQNALLAFGRRSKAHPNMLVLLQDAATLVEEVLHADNGGVAQVDGDKLRTTFLGRDRRGSPTVLDEHIGPLDPQNSIIANALQSGTHVTCENLFTEKRFQDAYLTGKQIVSALVLPLVVQGAPFGAIGIFSGARRVFSYDDVTFAETIANFVSCSLARIVAETKLAASEANNARIKAELDRVRTLTDETSSTLGQLSSQLELPPVVPTVPTDFQLVESQPHGAERRKSPRRAYRVRQWIAPATAGRTPGPKDFREVDFFDLSSSGCSFYLDHPPDFKALVVALGRPPLLTYFSANVVRVAPVTDEMRASRRLVGCEFSARVYLPSASLPASGG